jgi:hypothetical protein
MHLIQAEMRRVGIDPPLAPSYGASRSICSAYTNAIKGRKPK